MTCITENHQKNEGAISKKKVKIQETQGQIEINNIKEKTINNTKSTKGKTRAIKDKEPAQKLPVFSKKKAEVME
jgi:hypothetical protein